MTTPSIQAKRTDPPTYQLPLSDDATLRLRRLEAHVHILDAAVRAVVDLLDQPDQRSAGNAVRALLDDLHD